MRTIGIHNIGLLDPKKMMLAQGLSSTLLAKLLFLWDESDGIANDRLENQLGSDYITIGANDIVTDYIPATSSATFTVPNTTAYLDADGSTNNHNTAADDFWFSGATPVAKTVAQLSALNGSVELGNTFIKTGTLSGELVIEPFHIRAIAIVKDGETLTQAEKDNLSAYMFLDVNYFGVYSDYSYVKGNRGGIEYSTLEYETYQYVTRLPDTPYDAQVTLLNSLISGLKTDGLYNLIDLWQLYANSSSDNALQNVIKDAIHATLPVAPTFTAGEGFKGNGTTQYINSNYNGSLTDSTKFTANESSFHVWVNDLGALNGRYLFGSYESSVPRSFFQCLKYASATSEIIYYNGQQINNSYSFGTGLWSFVKTIDNYLHLYYNGSPVGTPVQITAQQDIFENDLYVLCRNSSGVTNGFDDSEVSMILATDFMDATQVSNLYTRLNTYMTGIAAALAGDAYSELAQAEPPTSSGLFSRIEVDEDLIIKILNTER